MNGNECAACKYYQPLGDGAKGNCTRYPPVPFPTSPGQVTSFWPPVRANMSCGEYKPRIFTVGEMPRVVPGEGV